MASEKSSSVIGFALIGIILLLFSWYNTKQQEKILEAQFEQDSIAAARALELSLAKEAAVADSTFNFQDSSFFGGTAPMYQSDWLNMASNSDEEFFTIENDKISLVISSKGAQPYDVLIKDYYAYDSSALRLIRPKKSFFDLELNTDQWLNTSDLNFSKSSSTANSLSMRLHFDEDSFIEAIYSLAEGSYMVDYKLRFVNMDGILDPTTGHMTMNWVVDMPRLEKGYQNEKNYSGIGYRYSSNTDVKTVGQRKDNVSESFSSSLRWFGFQQQFFSAIMMAENGFSSGTLSNSFFNEDNSEGNLMHSGAEMAVEIDPRNPDVTIPFKFYFGPNHYPTLKGYDEGFEKIIPLGGKVIGTISRYVIIPTFNWLSKSIKSYGLIILILTLMIKLVISPLTWKSYSSSAKMKVLQPEIKKINEKYPKQEDAMKKQQATMDLYRRAGVSIWGGCLPVLLQFPILWAMFRFFPASIELRQQGFLWANDLSTYDSILDFGFKVPLYGDHISLFALLMAISMWGYSKMTVGQQSSTNEQMPGMNFMQVWLMPIMMLFVCNNLSAGLSYYYLLSNLCTIGQNWAIRKWFVDEKKIHAKLMEKASSKAPAKKSKFQLRLEEAQRIQQEQMKAKQNKR